MQLTIGAETHERLRRARDLVDERRLYPLGEQQRDRPVKHRLEVAVGNDVWTCVQNVNRDEQPAPRPQEWSTRGAP